ncbi:MAG: hypothetical protein RLZ44_1092, partial [Pseudomonadota bacterium]
HSYALINDDASLVVQNRVVHLAGVYVPTTRTSCIDAPRPGCRTRAAAALEFRIQGFVQCDVLGRRCAGEGAPYEYRAVADLARAQSAGIWGNTRIWTPRGYR